jgi:hypothetical protein
MPKPKEIRVKVTHQLLLEVKQAYQALKSSKVQPPPPAHELAVLMIKLQTAVDAMADGSLG